MSSKPAARPRRRSLLQGKEGLRFAVMIVLMIVFGAVFFGLLDSLSGDSPDAGKKPIRDVTPEITIPPINRKLLATVKDSDHMKRLDHEADVYEHLLECARYILPGSLRAMGLPDKPVTVEAIRENPAKFRGKPVAFEGEVWDLYPAVPIPGMPGYKKTEGFLQTARGNRVFFAVISDIPKDIKPGKFARVEGFFFKLRDFNFPEKLTEVPHVVGFELKHAFGRFRPVRELDPAVLATIHDDEPKPGNVPEQPLYHISSWVMNRARDAAWKRNAPPLGYEDYQAIVGATGEVPRGKVFRVLGELYDVQIKLAPVNPLGVRYWSRAWMKHRYGTVQLDVPGRLPGGWRTGDYVVFYGAFFKRHWYEAGLDARDQRVEKIVPLFVADRLYHWKIVDNPANVWIKATLAGITLLLIGLVGLLVIRDSRADQEVRQRILERRRKRRVRAH